MARYLDPGAQDPDLEYLVLQLRHIGSPVEAMEEAPDGPTSARCDYSGLTIPECACKSCTRELIMRYRPRAFLR